MTQKSSKPCKTMEGHKHAIGLLGGGSQVCFGGGVCTTGLSLLTLGGGQERYRRGLGLPAQRENNKAIMLHFFKKQRRKRTNKHTKKASQKKTIGISVIRFCKGMKTGPRTKVAVTNSACFGVRCLANKYKKMIVPRLNMDMSR